MGNDTHSIRMRVQGSVRDALVARGMDKADAEAQAETHALAVAEGISMNNEILVTRDYLDARLANLSKELMEHSNRNTNKLLVVIGLSVAILGFLQTV